MEARTRFSGKRIFASVRVLVPGAIAEALHLSPNETFDPSTTLCPYIRAS